MIKTAISAILLSLTLLQAEETSLPVKIDPAWSAPDTNPSSKTFGKKLSVENFKGTTSLWLITFDCDC